MFTAHSFEAGQIVQVKVNGELVDAVYQEWHDEYNMAIVSYNGKRLYRKVYSSNGVANKRQGDIAPTVKTSRFDVNTRFQFISDVVDMVVAGDSKAVIISGSGGLGKTFTVMARLKEAGLTDFNDIDNEAENGGDYVVFKGYSTPKSLYRQLWTHRKRIVIFDDMDSVWDNPTAVSLLKAALDSYDTRRISWLAEIRGEDDDLPQSFEFEGKVIFVSNLSLTELDQAVLSRSLYVDVSMTPQEKIDRIRAISGDIRTDMPEKSKADALALLSKHADTIGDLNIRTFLKVLEIRHKGAANWEDLAEYVITAL